MIVHLICSPATVPAVRANICVNFAIGVNNFFDLPISIWVNQFTRKALLFFEHFLLDCYDFSFNDYLMRTTEHSTPIGVTELVVACKAMPDSESVMPTSLLAI